MISFQIKYAGNPNLPEEYTHLCVDSNLNVKEFIKEFDNIIDALNFYKECYQPITTEKQIYKMINESLKQETKQQSKQLTNN